MGYYTNYSLTVTGDQSLIETLRKENEEAAEAICRNGVSRTATKWYNWEDDMAAFSASHPEVLFALSGEGEGSGDLWRCYFKGGKKQHEVACVSFGDFDAAKLVT